MTQDHVTHLREVCASLTSDYYALFAVTSSQSLEQRSGEGRGSWVVPPIPVRVDVLDTIEFVSNGARACEAIIRREVYGHQGAARRRDVRDRAAGGFSPDVRVVEALRYVSDALGHVVDAPVGAVVTDTLYAAQRAAARALGRAERVYPLPDSTCPACGCRSLLAFPDRGAVSCGYQACDGDAGRPWSWRYGERSPWE